MFIKKLNGRLPLLIAICASLSACNNSATEEVRPESTYSQEEKFINERLSDENTADDAYYRMMQDAGGLTAYENMRNERTLEEVKAFHEKHGYRYLVIDDESNSEKDSELVKKYVLDVDGYRCHNIFWNGTSRASTPDVNEISPGPPNTVITELLNADHEITTDTYGRPIAARVTARAGTSFRDKGRDLECQEKARRSGLLSYNKGVFHGGHLIPRNVGGYPGELNLFPQAASMNNGPWKKGEYAFKTCLKQSDIIRLASYTVRLTYNSNRTTEPYRSITGVWTDVIVRTPVGLDQWLRIEKLSGRVESTHGYYRMPGDRTNSTLSRGEFASYESSLNEFALFRRRHCQNQSGSDEYYGVDEFTGEQGWSVLRIILPALNLFSY